MLFVDFGMPLFRLKSFFSLESYLEHVNLGIGASQLSYFCLPNSFHRKTKLHRIKIPQVQVSLSKVKWSIRDLQWYSQFLEDRTKQRWLIEYPNVKDVYKIAINLLLRW